mgnify:FL=1
MEQSREVLDELAGLIEAYPGPQGRRLLRSIVDAVADLARDQAEVADLKIANAAIGEMAEAFAIFRPYRGVRKLTMFGSARTKPQDPVYTVARDLAREMADLGWMVVTGAGEGIMAAGIEGAGREHSFGVNIQLPFEQGANAFIAEDPKLIEMKYFFTRKLMLLKESHGFAVLPGGIGTLDETFELLTLIQTGKATPAPVVLVETPGGGYWERLMAFLADECVVRGYVSVEDLGLLRIASSVEEAVAQLEGFYANYRSSRYVDGRLVLRLNEAPTTAGLAALTREFGDLLAEGAIERAEASPVELRDRDEPDAERVVLSFNRVAYGRLRELIDALNSPAP